MIEEHTIRKVGGTEAFLLMGCDRELFLMSAGISIFLIVYVRDWYAAIFGVLLWLFVVWGLSLMGKADPQMRQKYRRSQIYTQNYYPAKATHFNVNKRKY